MVFFNYALRKLNAKIVYYGPGLCGKTTNLQWIHDHFEGGQRGKMISLATEGDRTIFFDLLPIDIGSIRGMDVTLQLYTVPGQVHYNSTRQLVLRGADGVVFVADSQRTMKSSNAESFENLQENLLLQGIDLKEFPHILQFNKRDLRDLLSPEDLNESLNVFSTPIFEAIATEGIGVQESLEGIVKLVMRNLREKYEPVASATGPQALKPMKATGPLSVQPPADQPAAATPGPMASDFVSELETPPAVDPGEVATPAFTATPIEVPKTVEFPTDETRDIGTDAGFAANLDEDGISTAVYKPDDEKLAAAAAEFDGPDFGAEATEFTPDADTAANELKIGQSDESGGLFTDPRDEDGTDADEVIAVSAVVEPEPEIAEPDIRDELSTDPKIVVESLEPVPPEESLDDLFETEVPTVKAFVEDVMEVVETEGMVDGDEEPRPPVVDLPEMVVASSSDDRFEDRIEAPGPFAPAPTSEQSAEDIEKIRADEEAVRVEVRQALGASEDREALASLSAAEVEEPKETFVVPDESVEAEPAAPQPPEEPVATEAAVEVDEITPAAFVADEPESVVDEESDWGGDQDEKSTEVAELVAQPADVPEDSDSTSTEPPIEEPIVEDAIVEEVTVEEVTVEEVTVEEVTVEEAAAEEAAVEETPVEEPIVEEAIVDETPVEEPITAEPAAEEPVAEDQVMPPPVVDDPLTKSQPITIGSGDPFAADDNDVMVPEVLPREAPIVPSSGGFSVTAQNNQLHLQLKGSGAIAEMGQVRALDIEVPVPGEWVGNQKVTLQLRLTLTPAEDEDV